MSEASPFTFHVVGRPDEPQHYELRDLSGRVVCKAFLSGEALVMITTDSMELRETSRGVYAPEDLEALMREVVR